MSSQSGSGVRDLTPQEVAQGLKDGRVFILFLALYGAVRFTAEFWRDGDILWLGLTLAQLASLAIIALVSAGVPERRRHRRGR
jgi:prolipoprotein diacylglyceryltransferase